MKEKIKEKYNFLKDNYKEIWLRFKENFKNKEFRKKYIVIGLVLILNVLLINIFFTFAYYEKKDAIPILQATVGDFELNKSDYSLLVYIEDATATGIGSGTYHLTYAIPSYGYTYSGYSCKNNSTLLYDEVTKETTVTITQKESCSIYFNLSNTLDLSIKVMVEEKANSNKYKISNTIPDNDYTYTRYECMNGGSIDYDAASKKFTMNTNKKEYCFAYFNKNS